MFKVQKKDGSLQDFDRSKITGGAMKAGASSEEAEKVAVEIESWLPTNAVNGVLSVLNLRTKVLEVLRGVNPTVAANFEAYKKPA